MTRPYSNDLRARVVRAHLAGEPIRSVAARFGVSVSSVPKWTARCRATGSEGPDRPVDVVWATELHAISSAADAAAQRVGYLNFIPDTLLLYATFRADKQDLAHLVAECVFQQTLPVLAAAQSEHVFPYFVPGRG